MVKPKKPKKFRYPRALVDQFHSHIKIFTQRFHGIDLSFLDQKISQYYVYHFKQDLVDTIKKRKDFKLPSDFIKEIAAAKEATHECDLFGCVVDVIEHDFSKYPIPKTEVHCLTNFQRSWFLGPFKNSHGQMVGPEPHGCNGCTQDCIIEIISDILVNKNDNLFKTIRRATEARRTTHLYNHPLRWDEQYIFDDFERDVEDEYIRHLVDQTMQWWKENECNSLEKAIKRTRHWYALEQ